MTELITNGNEENSKLTREWQRKNGTWISLSDYKAPLRRPQHMTTTPPLDNKEVLMPRQRKDGVNAVGDCMLIKFKCVCVYGYHGCSERFNYRSALSLQFRAGGSDLTIGMITHMMRSPHQRGTTVHDSVTPTTAIHNINLAWLRRDCDARITTPELALLGVYQGSRVGSNKRLWRTVPINRNDRYVDQCSN